MAERRRSHWDINLRTVWSFKDRVSGEIIEVRVASKFKTTDGMNVSLRHPETDAPLGNANHNELLERIRR